MALLLAFVFIFTPAAMATTQSAAQQKVDYLALGDSLAAGQTPYKELGKGYSDYLAQQLNKVGALASFDKRFAQSGYTTTDVLNDLQTNATKPNESGNAIDIKSAITNAEILTINVGANDILQQIDIDLKNRAVHVDPVKVESALRGAGENLFKIITAIKTLNPNVDIYVMGYFNPFPILPEPYKSQILPLLAQLNNIIEQAAAQSQATFVPVADSFALQGSNYLPNMLDVHPNEAGYLALSNHFWRAIDLGKSVEFTDLIPDWAEKEVHYLAQKGIINGYENGAFGASDPIIRLHSALLLDRSIIFSDDLVPNPAYADINEGNYGYEVVARLTAEGIFSGSNQHFYPDHSLTRAEMAKIIVEAFELKGTTSQSFSDTQGHWGANYISILAENSITDGYPDGTFQPDASITRAEFSTMVARVLNSSFVEN